MFIKSYELGPLGTNSYLVACEKCKEAIVVDPVSDGNVLAEAIEENGFKLCSIVNTHDHSDHTAGNLSIKERFNVPIYIHRDDAERLKEPQDAVLNLWFKGDRSPPADIILEDGDEIKVGDFSLKVIHTPGHTPGGICLLSEEDEVLFSGDTLMAGSIGRTDLMGGSYKDIILSIKMRLLTLNEGVTVYPGHGGTTTIGHEKRHNMFLR